MINIWLFLDKIKERILRYIRKEVFLAKINSKNKDVKILGKIYINSTKIKIGSNVLIYPGVSFSGGGEICIGDNVAIGQDTMIYIEKKLVIGNDVAIAAQSYIIDCNHGTDLNILMRLQPLEVAEDGIYIGNDVWIAAGCKIIKGAYIEDGAVIGAMSLVNNKIAANTIAIGVPAKSVKYRS